MKQKDRGRSKASRNRGGRKPGDLHLLRRVYLYIRRADKFRVALLLSFIFLLVTGSGLFTYLFIQDLALGGKIFNGITIDDKPVGGMSRDEAADFVNSNIVGPLEQPIVLYCDKNEFALNPGDIEISFDVPGMVNSAYYKGTSLNILSRMYKRFTGEPLAENIPLIMKYNKEKLENFIGTVAGELECPPKNASIDMSEGRPKINYARNGSTMNREKTIGALIAALSTGNRRVPIVQETVEPDITDNDIKYIVVVRLSQHVLELYKHEELVYSFPSAVGSPEYPTPTGKFYIVSKEKDPTWIPPKSDWAKDKQPIPPGPGNPLGPYWMSLGGSLGIHSTPDPSSLGYSVSHGCIRLSEWSAMQVFNAVNKGTPVYILP
ncbi:MAG: L,D-transpeptidase/peptidoglycan binding protein [Actinobacteria bacterium]|nr:L,D-transpeptidase/peptidoglycan binding protein [Actinomycetota bacterium]